MQIKNTWHSFKSRISQKVPTRNQVAAVGQRIVRPFKALASWSLVTAKRGIRLFKAKTYYLVNLNSQQLAQTAPNLIFSEEYDYYVTSTANFVPCYFDKSYGETDSANGFSGKQEPIKLKYGEDSSSGAPYKPKSSGSQELTAEAYDKLQLINFAVETRRAFALASLSAYRLQRLLQVHTLISVLMCALLFSTHWTFASLAAILVISSLIYLKLQKSVDLANNSTPEIMLTFAETRERRLSAKEPKLSDFVETDSNPFLMHGYQPLPPSLNSQRLGSFTSSVSGAQPSVPINPILSQFLPPGP